MEEWEDASPSETEELFAADTSTAECPVHLWTHDGGLGKVTDSLSAFLEAFSTER